MLKKLVSMVIVLVLSISVMALTTVVAEGTEILGYATANVNRVIGRDSPGEGNDTGLRAFLGKSYPVYKVTWSKGQVAYVKLKIQDQYAWFWAKNGYFTLAKKANDEVRDEGIRDELPFDTSMNASAKVMKLNGTTTNITLAKGTKVRVTDFKTCNNGKKIAKVKVLNGKNKGMKGYVLVRKLKNCP